MRAPLLMTLCFSLHQITLGQRGGLVPVGPGRGPGGGGEAPDPTGGDCGPSEVTLPSNGRVVNLTSPGFPNTYPNSLECDYRISTDVGKKIFMYISFFRTEPSYDIVKIGRGGNRQDSTTDIVTITGISVRLKRLWTPGDTAWITFTTDSSKGLNGFMISMQAVDKRGKCVGDREVQCDNGNCIDYRGRCNGQNDCGDSSDESKALCSRCPADNIITLPETGMRKLIWTPGYPNRYPSSIQCYWYINSTTPGSRISAYVEDFNLEESYDWWTAGSGDNIKDSGSLLVKLSGEPTISRVISPDSLMWIGFNSDDRINKVGFWIYVHSISGRDNCTDYGNYFQCHNDFCVKSSATCNGNNDCLDNSDETTCETINCGEGRYWCRGDWYCISVDNICDGIQHCSLNDDELNCDKQKCPQDCMCYYRTEVTEDLVEHQSLVVNCTKQKWRLEHFTRYPQQIDTMMLTNADVPFLPSTAQFKNFTLLKYLSLVDNKILKIEGGAFIGLISVTWLDLSKNKMTRIEGGAFIGLSNLETLIMYDIPLKYINTQGLNGLDSLKAWYLQRNLAKTQSLQLDGKTYVSRTRNGLTKGETVYSGIEHLDNLYVDDYRLCCYLKFIKARQCSSLQKIPQFFDCKGLVKQDSIKICLWLINLIGIVANILLIEIRNRNYNKIGRLFIPSFMFGNMAISGVLMGVYSLMIGFIDISNDGGGRMAFFVNSDEWRESIKCKISGVIALIAIQSLIFILTAISVERYIKVMHPNSKFVISVTGAKIMMVVCWALALVLGVMIPLLSKRNTYGWSDSCIGLPLHRLFKSYDDVMIGFSSPVGRYDIAIPTAVSPDQAAWPLSIALFLVIDPLCLLLGLCLFLIIKCKGIHEELPEEEDEDVCDDIKRGSMKAMVDDKELGTPSTAQAGLNGGDQPRAVHNEYIDPSAPPHEYETIEDANKSVNEDKKDERVDDDGAAAIEPTKKPEDKEMRSGKSTGRKYQARKRTISKKKSIKRKKPKHPEDQVATVTDGVVFSDDPTVLGENGSKVTKEGVDGKQNFMTLEGADLVMSKEDLEAGLEQRERKKKRKKRRRKKIERGDEVYDGEVKDADGHTNIAMSEEKGADGCEAANKEDGLALEDKDGSGSKSSTSDDEDESSDEEVEIEERRITSKHLATKMMRLFLFDLSMLVPIFIVGILSQTGAVDIPIEVTYWAALFVIPLLFSVNPVLICLVDVGGIQPKTEWEFDEVSFSETSIEKRERIAREAAMSFL